MSLPVVAVILFLVQGQTVGGIVAGAAESTGKCRELAQEALTAHKAETTKMLEGGAAIRVFCVDADGKPVLELTQANLPEQTGKQSFIPREQ